MKFSLLIKIISTSVIFLACTGNSQNVNPFTSYRFSDEQMFTAVMFKDGPAAGLFPSNTEILKIINQQNEQSISRLKKYRAYIDFTISQIKLIDKNHFVNFKGVLSSGDVYEISNQLKRSSLLIEEIGLKSKQYGGLFRLAQDIKEDITLNFSKYQNIDFNTDQGNIQFKNNIRRIIEENNRKNGPFPIDGGESYQDEDACLFIWAAGAIVLLVTIAAVHNSVVAHNFLWTKTETQAVLNGAYNSDLRHEKNIVEILQVFNKYE